MGVTTTLLGAVLSISSYTASTVAQTFWLNSPLSLFGQFIFFLSFMSLVSFSLLACLACTLRDARVLLPHHDARGRRLFCCTLCGWAGGGGLAVAASAPHRFVLAWASLSQTEVLALMGLNNGLAAVLQWYATPPSRQPPLIAALLSSLTVVASIPLSRYALGDSKPYGERAPLAAVALVLAGVVVALLPAALSPGGALGGESARDVILWTLLNAASQVPGAMASIASQAYLLRAGALLPGAAGRRASLVGVLRFVAYNQIAVAALAAALFWVDVLPWFGSTRSLTEFATGLAYSFRCSLLGPGAAGAPPAGTDGACQASAPLYAFLSIAPYAGYLAGMALVSQDSGVFSVIVSVVTSLAISLIWIAWPGLNPDSAATPLWAVLPSLACGLAGTIVFKRWEMRFPERASLTAAGLDPVEDDLHEAETRRGRRLARIADGGSEEVTAAFLGGGGGDGGGGEEGMK